MHVASLDFSGAEHEAAERVGVDERAAHEIGRPNRAGLVDIHRRQRFRMREAMLREHRGAGERSPGARSAKSRVDSAHPRRNLDAFYERWPGAGQVNESCAGAGFRLEHAEIRRRHQLVGALDEFAPLWRARIEDYRAHARSSLAVSMRRWHWPAQKRRSQISIASKMPASALPWARRSTRRRYARDAT